LLALTQIITMLNGPFEARHHQILFLFIIHCSLFKFQCFLQQLKVLSVIIISGHDVQVIKIAFISCDVPEQKELLLFTLAHQFIQWILKFFETNFHFITQNTAIARCDESVNISHGVYTSLWRVVIPARLKCHEVLSLIALCHGDDDLWLIELGTTVLLGQRADAIDEHDNDEQSDDNNESDSLALLLLPLFFLLQLLLLFLHVLRDTERRRVESGID